MRSCSVYIVWFIPRIRLLLQLSQPMRDAIDNMNGRVLDGRNIATMESLVALLLSTPLALPPTPYPLLL